MFCRPTRREARRQEESSSVVTDEDDTTTCRSERGPYRDDDSDERGSEREFVECFGATVRRFFGVGAEREPNSDEVGGPGARFGRPRRPTGRRRRRALASERSHRRRSASSMSAVLSSPSASSRPPERRRARERWRSAVDPATGRVYYFETFTRRTQWEKPAQLVSSDDDDAKARKRREDRAFFAEMEANIRRSLERGQPAPGMPVRPAGPGVGGFPRGGPSASEAGRPASRGGIVGTRSPTSVAAADDVLRPHRAHPRAKPAPAALRPPPPFRRSSQDAETRRESVASSVSQGAATAAAGERGHVRRSTCGTICLASHLSRPDPDAAVRGACALFRELMLKGSVLSAPSDDATPSSRRSDLSEVFDDEYGDGTRGGGGGLGLGLGPLPSPRSRRSMLRRIAEAGAGLLGSLGGGSAPSPPAAGRRGCAARRDDDGGGALPPLDLVVTFFSEFHRRARMEPDAAVVSLLYVLRLVGRTGGAVRPGPSNWRSVLLSCMCLASKVWDDLSMWNADFARVCRRRTRGGQPSRRGHPRGPRRAPSNRGADPDPDPDRDLRLRSFTLARINLLERTLLRCLGFDASVSAAAYAALYFRVRGASAPPPSSPSLSSPEPRSPPRLESSLSPSPRTQVQVRVQTPEAPLLDAEGARRLGVPLPAAAPRSRRRARSLHDYGALLRDAGARGVGGGGGGASAGRPVCLEQVVAMC